MLSRGSSSHWFDQATDRLRAPTVMLGGPPHGAYLQLDGGGCGSRYWWLPLLAPKGAAGLCTCFVTRVVSGHSRRPLYCICSPWRGLAPLVRGCGPGTYL